jgi:hypothetical protein
VRATPFLITSSSVNIMLETIAVLLIILWLLGLLTSYTLGGSDSPPPDHCLGCDCAAADQRSSRLNGRSPLSQAEPFTAFVSMDLANAHGLSISTAPTIAPQSLLQRLLGRESWPPSGDVCCGPAADPGAQRGRHPAPSVGSPQPSAPQA